MASNGELKQQQSLKITVDRLRLAQIEADFRCF